jgi:hypothetical protein
MRELQISTPWLAFPRSRAIALRQKQQQTDNNKQYTAMNIQYTRSSKQGNKSCDRLEATVYSRESPESIGLRERPAGASGAWIPTCVARLPLKGALAHGDMKADIVPPLLVISSLLSGMSAAIPRPSSISLFLEVFQMDPHRIHQHEGRHVPRRFPSGTIC